MTIETINLDDLKKPFAPDDIEWRIAESGKKKNGEIWAKCLAYLTNRAIMNRLDEVVGPAGWSNEFKTGPGGGILCGISLRLEYPVMVPMAGGVDQQRGMGLCEWVTKWDGADNTHIEAVKGGLSDSMKRAAVQWGIGRYLYDLEPGWAAIHPQGEHYSRLPVDKGGESYRWDHPTLPVWAVPAGAYDKNEGVDVPTVVTKERLPAPGPAKPNRAAKKSDGPMLNTTLQAEYDNIKEQEARHPELDPIAPALAKIRNAANMLMLTKCQGAINKHKEDGDWTKDQINLCEAAIIMREGELMAHA